MDCGHIQSLFTAYQDREIDHRDLPPFESHLAGCPQCAREWQDFQKTLRLLRGMKPLPVPFDLLPGIHEKLGRESRDSRLHRWLRKIFPPLPLTAASLAAAALAVTVLIKTHEAPGPEGPALVAPPARIAQAERTEARTPPLAVPVSVGRSAGDSSGFPRPAYSPGAISPLLPERERTDPRLLAAWHDHMVAAHERRPAAGAAWQVGPPLLPDVVIRVHHLSPDGMKRLHGRIKKDGRWQTRLYAQDYFLVLVNPDELAALYELLQLEHLPFSTQSLPEAEMAVRKPLLVAVRP